jgi:hypothetical protein
MHRSDSRLIEWWKALRSQEPRQSARQRHCLPHGRLQTRRVYFGDVRLFATSFCRRRGVRTAGIVNQSAARIRLRYRHWLDYERTAASNRWCSAFRAATNKRSCSHVSSSKMRASLCLTSRPRALTSAPRATSMRSFAGWRRKVVASSSSQAKKRKSLRLRSSCSDRVGRRRA